MTIQAESGRNHAVQVLNVFVSSAAHYSYFITFVQVEMVIRECPIFVLLKAHLTGFQVLPG